MEKKRKYFSIFILTFSIIVCFIINKINYNNTSLLRLDFDKDSIVANAGCIIKMNGNEENWQIYDNGKFVRSGGRGNSYTHTCTSTNCYVKFINNFKENQTYWGLAGDGNCSTGVRTTGKQLWCASTSITPSVCYKAISTITTTKTTNNSGNTQSKTLLIKRGTTGGTISVHYGSGSNTIDTTSDGFSSTCTSESCIVELRAQPSSGYEFTMWSSDSNCKTKEYDQGIYYKKITNSGTVYACFKPKATVNTKTLIIKLADSKAGKITVKNASGNNIIDTMNNGFSSTCTSESCIVELTANPNNGYDFVMWSSDSNCKNMVYDQGIYYKKIEKSEEVYACFKNNSTSNGGTPTPPTTTSPIVTEPIVQDKFTVNVNSYVWAKGNEYMGNSISCGDKLYITKCTDEYNSVCKVTSINGKNVSTETQIYKKDYTTSESDTGCFKDITRYISEKTYSYTNSSLDSGKTEVSCGTTVVFKEAIETACTSLSCKVNINDKTVYVERDKIASDKPACEPNKEDGTCTSSERVTDLKGVKNIKLCKKDDIEENRDKIVTCAGDYEASYNLVNDKCTSTSSDNCYREYKYNCSYMKRPSVSVSAGTLGTNGTGTITIYGKDNGNVGLKGYFISSGEAPTQNSDWVKFSDTSYKSYETKTAGSYFIWVLNNKNRVSYPIMAKVYDADMSTTLETFKATDAAGNNLSMNGLDDNSVAYTGVVDSKYALLSNKLLESAEIAGFESLTTAYEINVVSNKVALYATLTSNDANYVSGYEPRTIDLDYGRNVALIKIVNNKGKERTYTFIINRIDDRDGSNLLSSLTISKGKLNFDSYVSSYDVSIPKNTKKVSINGTLVSDKAAFIQGYEPREITITEDVQSAVLKVRSESGSIRSYVVTFTRNGSDDHSEDNSTYLSSLSVPGTQLGFNKEVYDYTISIPYDTETIPIYAFGESSKAVVNISNNSGLKVGNNLVEIEVKNGNKTRIYSIHVIRKESGLDISNSNKLAMLSVKNYNINFNPDILDYVVKIKREKSLLITASPESNRADVYMVGNNDLTGFSTIRVKVIAENGLTNIYSIDIQKDPYNKTIELIAAVAGGLIFFGTAIIMVIRRKRKKMKEYLEG